MASPQFSQKQTKNLFACKHIFLSTRKLFFFAKSQLYSFRNNRIMMPSVNQLSISPVLKVLYPIVTPPRFNPFGGSSALNVLDSFLGTPDIVTKVRNKPKSYLEPALFNQYLIMLLHRFCFLVLGT